MKVKFDDVTVQIYLGDITKIEVDAIVNAAHSALMGGGGVDGAIHRAAGSGLLMECREIACDKMGVRCNTGEAYITGGYNLPAKHVIHTVAPKFVGGLIRREVNGVMVPIYKNAGKKDVDDLLMAECYRNCIRVAEENNLRSIAFPSLGTGGHAYPIEIACPIAINTIISLSRSLKSIKDIIFVCFSAEDYNFYKQTMVGIIAE